jgi:hypothetical protein
VWQDSFSVREEAVTSPMRKQDLFSAHPFTGIGGSRCLKNAIEENFIESREPFVRCFDVLTNI